MTSWNDETEWFYLGEDGKENVGPFSTTEMAEYHKDGAVDDEIEFDGGRTCIERAVLR